jgi:signal transduction histidine kinase
MHTSGLDQGRFAATLETTLYRIVQEALTNVLKHSGATRVSLIVKRGKGELLAIIEDDGRGFDRAAVMQASSARRQLGLRGMEERAALAGGQLDIETAVGAGTAIYVHLPLPPDAVEGSAATND